MRPKFVEIVEGNREDRQWECVDVDEKMMSTKGKTVIVDLQGSSKVRVSARSTDKAQRLCRPAYLLDRARIDLMWTSLLTRKT